MAQSRNAVRGGNRNRVLVDKTKQTYIQGNTVRKVDTRTYQPPTVETSHVARKNRDKANHMNFGYVLFLVGALFLAGIILTSYIGLQSEVTNNIKTISKMESKLNDMRVDNNEEYVRITTKIDLEEVKRIAITELGMKYAEEGQIVRFSGENSDYVRQIAEIPQ